MYLVEQHIITINDNRYKDLDRICFLSKNLYNAALYIIKQEFLSTGKWIRSGELNFFDVYDRDEMKMIYSIHNSILKEMLII